MLTQTKVAYDEVDVNLWTQQITDIVLCQLVNLCQPYKWVVNCYIMQKGEWAD